jgi:ATP-dependent Clp protease adaptor protein ClpS
MDNPDLVLDEKIITEYKEPGMYKVIFLNDDLTPMDFVVGLLTEIFKHTEESAVEITNKIHIEGSGIVGVYAYEIAEQKALESTNLCRHHGFPLRINVEEE